MTNQKTAAIGQLIELRANGWSYEKIARHTGIDKRKLLAWGIRYKDDIDALRQTNEEILTEIRTRRGQQESHFYNLPGDLRTESRCKKASNPLLESVAAAEPVPLRK